MRTKRHLNVCEYDGAFRCLDCHESWGALPGKPSEPPCAAIREVYLTEPLPPIRQSYMMIARMFKCATLETDVEAIARTLQTHHDQDLRRCIEAIDKVDLLKVEPYRVIGAEADPKAFKQLTELLQWSIKQPIKYAVLMADHKAECEDPHDAHG